VSHFFGIRNISVTLGLVGTVSGYGPGYREGPNPLFGHPHGIDYHAPSDSIFVADQNNNRVRRVWVRNGSSELVAGSGVAGSKDGYGAAATFNTPNTVLVEPRTGAAVWTVEAGAHCVRAVNLSSTYVSYYAGGCNERGMLDGTFEAARFSIPYRLRFSDAPFYRHMFLADIVNMRIRRLDTIARVVVTVVGDGMASLRGAAVSYFASLANPGSFRVSRVEDRAVLFIAGEHAVVRVNLSDASLYGFQTTTPTQSIANTRTVTSTASRSRSITGTASRSRSVSVAVHSGTSTVGRTSPSVSLARTPTLGRATAPASSKPLTSVAPPANSIPPPEAPKTVSRSVVATTGPTGSVDTSSPTTTTPRVIPIPVTVAAGGVALAATAVAGLVNVPIASRPAVVGAALRLSTCVVDGDGPDVPSYVALPVQVPVYSTALKASALDVGTNAAFVVVAVVGAWIAASRHGATAASSLPATTEGALTKEADTSGLAVAHAAATVPSSYIAPALVEFSVMWLSAAAASSGLHLGISALGFAAGLVVAASTWAVLFWKARWVAASSGPDPAPSNSNLDSNRRCGPWLTIVGPLLESTRDVAAPRVRYAFFVELGCGLLFCALSGIRVESLCVAKCVAATLVALAFLGYLLVVQPAAERMDHWFGVGFAALQLATGALVTAAVVGSRGTGGDSQVPWASTALDAADTIGLVTLALLVFQAVLNVALSAREQCTTAEHGMGSSAAGAPPGAPVDASRPLLELPDGDSIRETEAVMLQPRNPLVRIS
jgi:hypothetical protein